MGLGIEINQSEREGLQRLHDAILSGDGSSIGEAERAVVELARATGAAGVWEAWAFLTDDTNTAVSAAVRREREAIARQLEALYADPAATWDDIMAVARGEIPDTDLRQAG